MIYLRLGPGNQCYDTERRSAGMGFLQRTPSGHGLAPSMSISSVLSRPVAGRRHGPAREITHATGARLYIRVLGQSGYPLLIAPDSRPCIA
jgi:hypothetical protein